MSQNPKTISKKKSNLKKLPQLQLLQMEQLNTIADGPPPADCPACDINFAAVYGRAKK